MKSLIPSLEIINAVKQGPNIFLWTTASVADADVVNPNGIKRLLANGLSTFPNNGNTAFTYGSKSLPKNPANCPIIRNWVFESYILADEPFAKVLRSFKTSVLLNNNLWGKLFSSLESPTIFDERFNVTFVPFFIADFNLKSCELENSFNVLYWVIFILK